MKTEKNGVTIIQFENLSQSGLVCHGFSTRLGGVSQGERATMNLGFTRGDRRDVVEENFARLAQAVGVDVEQIVFGKQVHGTEILKVEKPLPMDGVLKSSIQGYDGLMTNVPGVALLTYHADCVPVFLLDTKQKAIAMVHSGWRGTVGGIGPKALLAMQQAYGTNPADVLVGIGPSIGLCHFQVGEEVVKAFEAAYPFAQDFWRKGDVPGKYKLDLWGIIRRQLQDGGVPEAQIETSGLCTMCDTQLFYSHRKMGEARGTMAAVLALKEE